jgi:hypothetical protein
MCDFADDPEEVRQFLVGRVLMSGQETSTNGCRLSRPYCRVCDACYRQAVLRSRAPGK